MGACLSKPASSGPEEGSRPSRASLEQTSKPTDTRDARQPAGSALSPAEQPSQQSGIDILPAPPSVAPSVAILPPWVSHNEMDMGRSPSSGAATAASTNSTTNPAANALRSNLSEVKSVLQQLTAMNPNPTIGLAEAAEMLCKHLGVALVSIVACTEGLASYILLASYGSGAAELEKNVVMKGADWSPFLLDSHTNHIYYSVENDEQALTLPKDWDALYRVAGIKSFMAVPIGGAGEVLGLLTIAKHEPGAFDDEWWEPMLGVLAVGLYPQLRNEQVAYLCHLVRVLHNTQDYLALVALLLQGAHRLLLKTTNIKMGVRLGLLKQDHSRALVFEVDSAKMKETDYLTASTTRETMADITITEIGLENTLLLDAINKGKARFVSDCASYLQSCMKPATDIFISSQQMVASIVVLPLMYGDQNLGGLYFTLETPSNFQNIKDMLMGFVNSIVLVLLQKLEGRLHHMWDAVVQRPLAMDGTSTAGGGSMDARDLSALQQQQLAAAAAAGGHGADGNAAAADGGGGGGSYAPGSHAADGNNAAAAAAGGVMGAGGGGSSVLPAGVDGGGSLVVGDNSTGNVNKKLFVKRNCTEAMLKVLQHEIRKTHARNQKVEWVDDLVLMETIGKGGFGVVYKGSWKGSLAAIKVMYARQHERQAMKDALEMAVLTTVSHPNIIQVYNCFTDMVEDAGTTPSAAQPEARINVRFRRLEPEEDRSLATCNIVVMEYCDKGSLRHAMKRGVFHKRLGSTSVAVDLCAIVQVLLEVAASVQHLHNMQLLHCDIKPENVLLKSDNSNPLGFTTKLSDFGLAKLLRDNYYIINRSGSGTVTHLAPELFQVGSKITTAVDTFSFGIMMWELYTGQRAYSGLGRDAIIDRVYKKQSRPVFPSGVPALYSNLARQCWETDVHLRPSFAQIRKELQEMLTAFQSGTYAGAGAAAEAVRERLQAAAAAPHNQLLPHELEQLQLQQLALQQQHQAGLLAGSFAMPGIGGQQQMQLQQAQAQLRAQLLQEQQQQQILMAPQVQEHLEQMRAIYNEFPPHLLQQHQAAAQLQAAQQEAAVAAQQQQQQLLKQQDAAAGQNGDVNAQQQQQQMMMMQPPLAQVLQQLQLQQQQQQQQQLPLSQAALQQQQQQQRLQQQQPPQQTQQQQQQTPQPQVESKA